MPGEDESITVEKVVAGVAVVVELLVGSGEHVPNSGWQLIRQKLSEEPLHGGLVRSCYRGELCTDYEIFTHQKPKAEQQLPNPEP